MAKDRLDEEQYDADENVTGEVGSEGGSPGETVVTRRRAETPRGSEATETVRSDKDRTETIDRVGDENQPLKRNP